jgi:hypothetical protein
VGHRVYPHPSQSGETRRYGGRDNTLMVEQPSRDETGEWALRVVLAPVLLARCDGVLWSMSGMVSLLLFLLSVQGGVELVAFARNVPTTIAAT